MNDFFLICILEQIVKQDATGQDVTTINSIVIDEKADKTSAQNEIASLLKIRPELEFHLVKGSRSSSLQKTKDADKEALKR